MNNNINFLALLDQGRLEEAQLLLRNPQWSLSEEYVGVGLAECVRRNDMAGFAMIFEYLCDFSTSNPAVFSETVRVIAQTGNVKMFAPVMGMFKSHLDEWHIDGVLEKAFAYILTQKDPAAQEGLLGVWLEHASGRLVAHVYPTVVVFNAIEVAQALYPHLPNPQIFSEYGPEPFDLYRAIVLCFNTKENIEKGCDPISCPEILDFLLRHSDPDALQARLVQEADGETLKRVRLTRGCLGTVLNAEEMGVYLQQWVLRNEVGFNTSVGATVRKM